MAKSKPKSWSQAELKLLHNPKLTNAQIAARIGRTVTAVEHQRRGMETTPTVESPADYWKDRFEEATKEVKKLRKQSTAVQVLVSEIQTIVPQAYSPLPGVTKCRKGKGADGQPQTAHLILSDSHVGQIVQPGQTMGLGEYGPLQYLRRLKYVEDSVLGICEEHVTTRIDELVVSILGDMIHGDLQHSNEAAHIMPIVDQVVVSSHSLAQFLRNCAPHFPKVRVKSVSGNHCVDINTEIFTKRGWLKYSEVGTTDECLGLDPDGNTVRWQPVSDVVVQPRTESMVSIKNREFSFNGTEGHRFYYWIPGHPMLNNAPLQDISLNEGIRIPANGFFGGDGKGVPDRFIELAAAVLTDGSIRDSGVEIYQSKDPQWIEDALNKSGLRWTKRSRIRRRPASIAGRKVSPGFSTEHSYRIQAEDARYFLEVTGVKKKFLPDWVWNMTKTQFDRFLLNLGRGDGSFNRRQTAPVVLYGKPLTFMGPLQGLCAMHGIRASLKPDRDNWKLLLCDTRHISVHSRAKIERHSRDGLVWCVRTPSENWLCRKDGISYFTGNSRWGTQRKMPTVNRYSSFDTLVYHMAKALLAGIPNIVWDLDEQPFAFYHVYDFSFLAIHGDHLRGGDKALGIPAHALGRELSFNAQVFPKSHLGKSPDYYIAGHLHTPMELPGNIIYNGGFPGTDNYSFSSRYLPSPPSQKLFLVHPKNGRSATWNLSIGRGDILYKDCIPYDIPEANLKRLA